MMRRVLLRNSKLLSPITFSYVRQRDLDEIRDNYGTTKMQKAKMYGAMFAEIAKQGFFGAKKDLSLFLQLRKKKELNKEQTYEYIRLRHDFYRMGPIVIIQILPMTGPLFFLYMYTYPGSIPSWFLVDKFHEQYQLKIRETQKEARQYWKSKQISSEDINFQKLSLNDSRKLCEMMFGFYRDGTVGYERLFGKKLNHFFSQGFSKYLMKRKLKFKFSSDLFNKQILQKMNLNEKIKWKYEKIMKGELMPKYEETLSAEELEARKGQNKNEKDK